jgi:sugar lactone lactonase YvrE
MFGYSIAEEGAVGDLAGTFNDASSIACFGMAQRADGRVLVASGHPGASEDPDVVELDATGAFLRNFVAAGPLNWAIDLAVAPDNGVVVADFGGLALDDDPTGTVFAGGGVYRFSPDGAAVAEAAPGFQFGVVWAVLVTGSGELLVLDFAAEGRILRFGLDPAGDGSWLPSGEFADGPSVGVPISIAQDLDGTFLVGTFDGTIARFEPDGTRTADFTGEALAQVHGLVILPGGNVVISTSGGDQFDPPRPEGLFELSPDGTLQRVLPLPADAAITRIALATDVVLHGRSPDTL